MLRITIPELDAWDEEKSEFVLKPAVTLELEHSLLAMSKWEAKWHKPFLTPEQKTTAEKLSYFECMIVGDHEPDIVSRLTTENISDILEYTDNNPATATWITSENEPDGRGEVVTTELIYYWMVAAQIPFDAERWHINRLFMLIRIYSEKNKPQKSMDRQTLMERQRRLNEQRLKEMGTNG